MAKAEDDLFGDAPKAEKKAAKGKDKPAKKATADKPAKGKTAADKPAKKAKAASTDRGAKGTGKFYFPIGSKEREAVKKTLLTKLKGPATTKAISEKMGVPTWQVRLCAKELAAEKKLKTAVTGNMLTVSPR